MRKETKTLDVNEQGGVTAQCPRGQRVAFGGFAGVNKFNQAQMFIDRATRPSGRDLDRPERAVRHGDRLERTISVGPNDQKSVTARCPRHHPVVA